MKVFVLRKGPSGKWSIWEFLFIGMVIMGNGLSAFPESQTVITEKNTENYWAHFLTTTERIISELEHMRTRRLEIRRMKTNRAMSVSEENSDDVPQSFQVSVTVLEARKLVLAKPMSATSYVVVVLGKAKHRTGVRRNTEDPYYGENFVFELHTSIRDMRRMSLSLAVMEARRPPRLVGEACIDLADVWMEPYHTVSGKWVQLTMPRDADASANGYLKVDVSILWKGQNSSPIPCNMMEEKAVLLLGWPGGTTSDLLPPGHEQQRACYQITVYGAYALSSSIHNHADRNSKPPTTFARISFSGLVANTSVIPGCYNPQYAEQISMVEMFPNICQSVLLEVCSADGLSNRVLAKTNLTLTQISHCVENGFLPTFGPSLLHMYGSSSGALEDGPYHRGSLLVALKTVVPYYKLNLGTISVEPVPPLKLETLWRLEDFCIYCSIFEVSMLDSKITSELCGVAITMGILAAMEHDCGDVGQRKLHYTGSMKTYISSSSLRFLDFANEFPVLQLAVRLPDFRFRMYRNNMIYTIVNDLERKLCNVEFRLRQSDYIHMSELVDNLNSIMVDASNRILKFRDIILDAMSEENVCTTELDRKQTRLQKEEMEKIYQRITKKSKFGSNLSLLSGYKTIEKSKDNCKKDVKFLLAQCRMVLQDLNSLIFPISDGWPDIVLWTLSSGSRVAYAKIAPADIVYSAIPEQRGRSYGQPTKCQKHINSEAQCDCIAAKVELLVWMGQHRQRSFFEGSLPAGCTLKILDAYMHIKCFPLVVECRVNIYKGKLYVEEDNKTMCPAVTVLFMNAVEKTQVKRNTVSPLWNEVIKITRNIYSTPQRLIKNTPEILLEVHDYTNGKGLVGRVQIVPEVGDMDDSPPALQWFDLYKGSEHTGRILLSAQLVQVPELLVKTTNYCTHSAAVSESGPGRTKEAPAGPHPIPDFLVPLTSTYKIDVYWWGLRDISIAHKPCVVLELEDVSIKSPIVTTSKTSCNFPDGRTSQIFEGDLSESLCSPLSIKLYDSSTFGRTLFVGLNEVRNPLKYMLDWLPKHERQESLYSNFNMSAEFVQVDQTLFLKKMKQDYPEYDDSLSFTSTKEQPSAKVSRWRRLFSRREAHEEQYTLLPVYNKNQVIAKSPAEERDWWMRYAASLRDSHDEDNNADDGFVIYGSELESQPEFSKFKDWCSTLTIYNGKKTGIPDKDDKLKCGYVKVGLAIYKWPLPGNTVAVSTNGVELDRGYFADHPDNEPCRLLVRVYLIKADLAAKGFFGKSEPYAIVQCGKKVLGGKNSSAPWTSNPVFGKMHEFRCSLPEDYKLRVSLMDRDTSPPDDLIGCTTIDLEDRVYTKHRACVGLAREYRTSGPTKWRDSLKPSAILEQLCRKNHLPPPLYPDSSTVLINGVEYRESSHGGRLTSISERKENICLTLLHKWQTLPICGHSLVPEHVESRTLYNPEKPAEGQGKIHLWLDIFPLECGGFIPPPVDITPRQMEEFELRVVVWDVEGVRLKGEEACDIYVKAWIGPSDEAQDTDIHYRSLKGEGSFNWRMVFHFQYQHTEGKLVLHEKGPFTEVVEHFPPILVVQVQDSQSASPEDFLGTLMLDLTAMPRGARRPQDCTLETLARRKVNLFSVRATRAWWPLQALDRNTSQYYASGKIDLELTLLPKEKAVLMPVGLGRDPPSPLPKPERSTGIPKSKFKCSGSLSCIIYLSALLACLVLVPFFLGVDGFDYEWASDYGFAASKCWNDIPSPIQRASSGYSFEQKLKVYTLALQKS